MMTMTDVKTANGQKYLAACNICGKQTASNNMPSHIEANHITGISHPCNICGKTSRSRDALRCHKNAHQTPRIPYSYCCSYCFVTKSALWRYLGNQAWYHRSAGVKTTGKKFWIRKFKIQKKNAKNLLKMVKNGQKWSRMVKMVKMVKMVQNGSKWSKMVQNGSKWWRTVKNGQRRQKWSKSRKMVKITKNGQNGLKSRVG